MTIADRYECFNLEKIVEEIRDIDIETLKNNISAEKDDGKRYNNHLSEERIQQIVIAYLDDKNIICEPSMSGIRIKSFKIRRKMREQGVKKGYPDLTIKKFNGRDTTFCLELKTVIGKLSKDQKEILNRTKAEHIPCSVSYGINDALYKINKYLIGKPVIWGEKGE
ncbi:VRR-NUC domain-containing protein [Brachyspira catarrhinii]|uniref:VRR-NUC domain-containing protein n=1 Tax=Brachyspira catarrhinii TaxID=2528966 RepID=A0ABY2TPN9_9SPIR|nr:VRR-NUC domain-containing protein [Brachyspira catarrhinii]TKZ29882.1 hypothetical protein EZH24_10765 [Brachyspira catarrhinii]